MRILVGRTTAHATPKAFLQTVRWNQTQGAAKPAPPVPAAISTADLLIDAARDAGLLEEFAGLAKNLVADDVERAEALAARLSPNSGEFGDGRWPHPALDTPDRTFAEWL